MILGGRSKYTWKSKLLVWMDRKIAQWRYSIPRAVCAILGGHEWGDWEPKASYNLFRERTVNHVRTCRACDKSEYFRAGDDGMKAQEPNHHFY